MSPNKTLYIRDDDMSIWERAEVAAKQTRQSVSQLVTTALQHYLPTVHAPSGELEEITVEVGEPARAVTFTGRWLVAPSSEATRGGDDAGAYWGVALTKRGRIAVFMAHVNERWPAELTDHNSLDDAGLPENIHAIAAAELGQDYVQKLDI